MTHNWSKDICSQCAQSRVTSAHIPYRQQDARRHGHLESNARSEEIYERDQRHKRHYGELRGEHRGRGPKDWVRSDERIKEDLNEQLTNDSYIDASEIQVAVKNGEITLQGSVVSKDARRRADDIAQQISGARQVLNALRVEEDV